MVADDEEPEGMASAKSSPVPLSVTVWGLLLALSVNVSVPLRLPVALGVKVTLMVQLAPGANELAQVLVWAKSPLVVRVSGVRAPLPVSVRVRVCGALVVETVWPGKLKVVTEKLATGATPVPLSATVWGLFPAKSVMVSVPVWDPRTEGWKLTLIVQLPMAAMVGTQLLSCFQPLEIATLPTLNSTEPIFMSVTGCGGLCVPTSWALKLKLVGETLAAETIPMPVSATVSGLPRPK
jgi:hypothetical protein